MLRFAKCFLAFLLLTSLTGCGLFNDVKEEVNDEMDKVEDNTNVEKEQKISDLMLFLKDNGITWQDETTLDNFDFSAKEGKSITFDGNRVYIYRVDMANAAVRALMNQAITDNRIVANRNGTEVKYGASANGDYLMVYELEAKVNDLLERFKEYKNNSAN